MDNFNEISSLEHYNIPARKNTQFSKGIRNSEIDPAEFLLQIPNLLWKRIFCSVSRKPSPHYTSRVPVVRYYKSSCRVILEEYRRYTTVEEFRLYTTFFNHFRCKKTYFNSVNIRRFWYFL